MSDGFRVACETHGVDHIVETEQAAYNHVNAHREVHLGCDDVSYEEINDE